MSLIVRASSLSLFIKNRELYKHIYVDGNHFPSSTAQNFGTACHLYLLENEKFWDEFEIASAAKHVYQATFCDLVSSAYIESEPKSDISTFISQISPSELEKFCIQSGYAASSSKTKWKELLADDAIIDTIRRDVQFKKTGIVKKKISADEFSLLEKIMESVKNRIFLPCTDVPIGDIVSESKKDGLLEKEIYMDYPGLNDVSIKSTVDQIYYCNKTKQVFVIDYKFVASIDGIEEKMRNDYRYDIQAAIYRTQVLHHFKEKFGIREKREINVVYVAVEKQIPFRVKHVYFSTAFLDKTDQEIGRAINQMIIAHETDIFEDEDQLSCVL